MKVRAIILFCMSLFTLGSNARDRIDFLIWDEGATQEKAREAASGTDIDHDPTLTVYPADKPNGKAILMCPGGDTPIWPFSMRAMTWLRGSTPRA